MRQSEAEMKCRWWNVLEGWSEEWRDPPAPPQQTKKPSQVMQYWLGQVQNLILHTLQWSNDAWMQKLQSPLLRNQSYQGFLSFRLGVSQNPTGSSTPCLDRTVLQLVKEHRPQLSQLTEPLWTDPGIKSRTSVRKLISTWKQTKTKPTGWELSKLPAKSLQVKKKQPSQHI